MVFRTDHKRAYEMMKPNTGVMGTFRQAVLTSEINEECMKTIFQPTVDASKRREKLCVLYFGLTYKRRM